MPIIRVLEHDIEYVTDKEIPARVFRDILVDMTDEILDCIEEKKTEGAVELYYYTPDDDEVPVDVQWKLIDYKQLAHNLYLELIKTTEYEVGIESTVKAVQEYKDSQI